MERLTPCELAIMHIVWGNRADMPETEVKTQLSERAHKEYARTTIATFVKRLEDKGYLEKYHVGRSSYLHASIPAREYGHNQLKTLLELYYENDREGLIKDIETLL